VQRGRFTTRRGAAALLAVLSAGLGLAACSSSPDKHGAPRPVIRTDNRPNIVFVLTDDLATNLVPYLPHVEALARAGASFRNYFVTDSLCCPSRASIFTGLFPHDDGVFTNSGHDGGYHAYNRYGNPAKSFAMGLQAAGYRTGFMGKYLNRYMPTDPAAPGWDEWDVAGNGYHELNYNLNENGAVHFYGSKPKDYLTDVLGTKAADFVKASGATGKPFALEIATFAPHYPWIPAPRDAGTFPTVRAPRGPAFDRRSANGPSWLAGLPPLSKRETRKIDAGFRHRVESVQAIDRMIGQVQQALAAEHQLANTYFVFSSDNGFHMGEHRLRAGKQTAFDTDIRVPLVIAGPGIPAGTEIRSLASSIDLAPTFLQMAGALPTDVQDGVSLLDLLQGVPTPPTWQRAVLIEHHGPVTTPGDPDLQRPRAGRPPSYEAMRFATSLYVEYDTGEREYYDLTRDPNELHNIAGTLSPRQLELLHEMLLRLSTCHGAAMCQSAANAVAPVSG
jgi:N-acetylglucosamine-6-sulfatase